MSKYRSRERVYETLANGITVLKYPVGAPIPDEEARRQGLIGADTAAGVRGRRGGQGDPARRVDADQACPRPRSRASTK